MEIIGPTLLINKEKCQRNIKLMVRKAAKNAVVFRPHFKTHQSAIIGKWYRKIGVTKITVSSIEMAEYFADRKWIDITIAFPVNIRELYRLNKLADKIKLSVISDSFWVVKKLIKGATNPINIFIEIDTGYHRTGISYKNTDEINNIIGIIQHSQVLKFSGFLTHSGNTYKAKTKEEIVAIHSSSIKKLVKLKQTFINYNKGLILSIGDTPGCSIATNFTGIDEIRPGNFVFYDWMQYNLGSCKLEDIAAVMVCPVVGKYEERKEIAIHGGAIHFSKEHIYNEKGFNNYGQVVEFKDDKWENPIENCYILSLSQEHGIIKCTKDFFDKIKIGELIGVYPIHSCLAMNLMKNNYLIV